MFKNIIILALLLPSLTAQAEPQLQETQLAELCSSKDHWYGGLCNGYITGTVESVLEMREQGLISEVFCFPSDMKRGTFIDAIRTEISTTSTSISAFEGILLILKDRYPCE
ncbi:Rap1a/Tai family immunity protein [Kiloniella sp.]|uniref:Rap1a/Tai family immunity protein n=1 Tax=Kiloniella sp. TaxID=1938587 RepID=UPI003B01A463